MTKQESIGLRIRKAFPNEEIMEDFYVKKFDCMIGFYLSKRNWQYKLMNLEILIEIK